MPFLRCIAVPLCPRPSQSPGDCHRARIRKFAGKSLSIVSPVVRGGQAAPFNRGCLPRRGVHTGLRPPPRCFFSICLSHYRMPRTPCVRTVTDFIRAVEKECASDEVLFRGPSSDYALIPRIGPPTFRHRGDPHDYEQSMLEYFRSRSLPYLDVQPRNDLEWLSVAQHYGMATRLLDWTQ